MVTKTVAGEAAFAAATAGADAAHVAAVLRAHGYRPETFTAQCAGCSKAISAAVESGLCNACRTAKWFSEKGVAR